MAGPKPICHLNGIFLPLSEARISPLDRSFLFGDGVYEVIPVFDGIPFRFTEHFDRLVYSLRSLRMRDPHSREQWRELIRELITQNGSGDIYVYVQVSRGAEFGRNHAPLPQIKPTVFAYCATLPRPSAAQLASGLRCVTAEDTRWARCDIKSVSLLANVLLRQLACDVDAHETILLREGFLMEASASTVHIVKNGVLITPPNSNRILPGTTRTAVESIADRLGIVREVRAITELELRQADEVWLASATRDISAVTQLDDQPVGTGRPGPIWQRVSQGFTDLRAELATQPW